MAREGLGRAVPFGSLVDMVNAALLRLSSVDKDAEGSMVCRKQVEMRKISSPTSLTRKKLSSRSAAIYHSKYSAARTPLDGPIAACCLVFLLNLEIEFASHIQHLINFAAPFGMLES